MCFVFLASSACCVSLHASQPQQRGGVEPGQGRHLPRPDAVRPRQPRQDSREPHRPQLAHMELGPRQPGSAASKIQMLEQEVIRQAPAAPEEYVTVMPNGWEPPPPPKNYKTVLPTGWKPPAKRPPSGEQKQPIDVANSAKYKTITPIRMKTEAPILQKFGVGMTEADVARELERLRAERDHLYRLGCIAHTETKSAVLSVAVCCFEQRFFAQTYDFERISDIRL